MQGPDRKVMWQFFSLFARQPLPTTPPHPQSMDFTNAGGHLISTSEEGRWSQQSNHFLYKTFPTWRSVQTFEVPT